MRHSRCLQYAIVIVLCAVGISLGRPQEARPIRVAVDVVLVGVSVMNSNHEMLTDLEAKDFTVFEDRVEQKIQYFSTETLPISLGIVFDVSSSMMPEAALARDATISFLRNSTQGDEYFLVPFGDTVSIAEDFTTNISRLETRLAAVWPKGKTALYDALYVGVNHVRQGQHPRKALLLITDGVDNKSRYTRSNVRELLRESGVQVYSIDLGLARIKEFSEMTGGSSYRTTPGRMRETTRRLAADMKNQYVLGYVSSNPSKDGAWRKIQVKVSSPLHKDRLVVRARQGYYGEQ
jgi:Ca-activated chloride channel family protein